VDFNAETTTNDRRALRYGCASVLTIFVAVLICSGLVLARCAGAVNGGGQAHPATTPRPLTGSAVLRADGVSVTYTDPDGTCRDPVLTATEAADQVKLSLTESDAGLANCVRPNQAPWFQGASSSVRLAAPLGSRSLVDALTGNAVPYFDERRGLRLPPSQTEWRNASGPPDDGIASAAAYFGGPGAAVMVQTLWGQDPSEPTITNAQLQIIQVSGGGWHPPPGTVMTPVVVRGHPGVAAAGIIVWTESGTTVAVTGRGSSPATAPPFIPAGLPLLTAELIGIAATLEGADS
jgi:hypothetical protein